MVWDQIAGTADHLAGSTDEAFARTFDDTPGGGLIDGYIQTAGGTALSAPLADAVDDESVARQFDDEPGGGAADVAAAQWWSLMDWAAGDVDDAVQSSLDVGNTARWGILLLVALGAGYAVSEYQGGTA